MPAGAALAAVLLAGGCAKEEPPPGTLPDRRPPQVARIEPGRDTVAPDFDGAARVRFDEPVALPGDFGRQVIGSPAARYQVRTGFSDVRIRPEEGWRRDAVYCFELPAGIADLLGNRTDAPIGFCFSTGPPVASTVVEGSVTDRVTGRPVPGARVLFLALPADTTPYTAVADRQGDFRLRALPPGTYWAYAFQDRNANLRLDRSAEPYDSVRFSVAEGPTGPSLQLAIAEPDSTPPVLVAALAEDSVTVRLEFDDFLLPDQEEASVTVTDWLGRNRPWSRLHVGDQAGLRRVLAEDGREERAAAAPARLPSRTALLLLEEPLERGTYRVHASGFLNLWRLAGGGDTTFVHPAAEGAGGRGAPPGSPRGGGRPAGGIP